MPTRKSSARTVVIHPEGMKAELELLHRDLEEKRKEMSFLLALERLDVQVDKKKAELVALDVELQATAALIQTAEEQMDIELSGKRTAFDTYCAGERRAVQEESERVGNALAARLLSAERMEKEVESRLEQVKTEEKRMSDWEATLGARAGEIQRRLGLLEAYELRMAKSREGIDAAALQNETRLVEVKKALDLAEQKEALIAVADQELGRRKQGIEESISQLAKRASEIQAARKAIDASNLDLNTRTREYAEAYEQLEKQATALSKREAMIAHQTARLQEGEDRMIARESRILQLEARVRDDEHRVEAAREEVRQAWSTIQQAKKELDAIRK